MWSSYPLKELNRVAFPILLYNSVFLNLDSNGRKMERCIRIQRVIHG